MEKSDKKRILTRVLIVIAALTLLSCCFLGSTFAKYVTSANGSGSVPVALWDIDVTNNAQTSLSFDKLSPDIDDGGVQSTGPKEVIEITISGDVQATVSYNVTISPVWRASAESDDDYAAYSARFSDIFSVVVTNSGSDLVLDAKTADPADSITLSATVYWDSLDDPNADLVDTWYGEWLGSITVTFNFTATQSSELPTT